MHDFTLYDAIAKCYIKLLFIADYFVYTYILTNKEKKQYTKKSRTKQDSLQRQESFSNKLVT